MQTTQRCETTETETPARPISLAELAASGGVDHRDVAAYVRGHKSVRLIPTLLLLVSLTSGCLAQTESDEPVAHVCAHPVACEFYQGTCSAERGMTYAETLQYDDGAGCWIKTAVCYPVGTPAECVPADCYQEVSLACDAAR